jgi:gamma-glutamylcyclotransferase (GGCT)/AIG2-like uncharacterized protein YtfP
MSNKRLIVTYGSLRNGHGNNRLLRDSELKSTEIINIPYRMVSLGGFPGLIPSAENHDIVVEIWEVNDYTYRSVEALEGWPSFYQKALVPTSLGEVEVYVLESPRYQSGYDSVESGDWNEFYKRRYAEA